MFWRTAAPLTFINLNEGETYLASPASIVLVLKLYVMKNSSFLYFFNAAEFCPCAIKPAKVTYDHYCKAARSILQVCPAGWNSKCPAAVLINMNLTFGNNQTLWKQAENDNDDDGGSFHSESDGARSTWIM